MIDLSQGFGRFAGDSGRERVVDRAEDAQLHTRSAQGLRILTPPERCAFGLETTKHSAQFKQLGR
jgi:hypothetical protein